MSSGGAMPKGFEKKSGIKTVNTNITKTDEDRDDLIFELIKKRYDDEWERSRAIDNKAGSLIGFVSIAVSFLLGTSSLGFFDFKNLNPVLAAFFIVGIGIMIGSIVKALYAFKVQEWDAAPNTSRLLTYYISRPYGETLKEIAGTMGEVISDMTPKINQKAKHLKGAWCILIVGLGFIFLFTSLSLIVSLGHPNV